MKLRELKEKHSKHLSVIRDLDSKEELTQEQSEELETRMKACEDLKGKIERRSKLETLSLESLDDAISPKEKRKYSLTNAVQLLIGKRKSGSSYEMEIHEQLEKRTKSDGGLCVPSAEIFGKPPESEKRLVDDQTSLVDDYIKPELYLPSLYESSITNSLGLKMISATGSYNFPRGSGTTAGWIDGSGAGADSLLSTQDQSFTSTSVEPHFLGCITGWSLRQLKQMASNLSLENILRSNMIMAMSEKLDDSLINSDNATTTYNPLGILKALGSGTNNETLDYSTTVGWTWSVFSKLKQQLREGYKNNLMSPKFLFHPQIEKELSDKQRFASSDGDSILESLPSVAVVSSHLANTNLLYGQWSEFMLTTFDSVELSLGMISDDFARGNQRLRAIGCFDFTLIRKEAFRQITITR